MIWEKLKPPEPDDRMCCCECDINQCRCCCDCEDLDEAFSSWLKEKPPSCGIQCPAFGTMMDNMKISMIPALLLLPLLLKAAALHYLLGIIILTALPGLVLSYYYATHRRKRRTLFFLTLALYSLAYMYYLFITEILPRGDVSPLQTFAVTTGMILTIVSLIHTKRGPGFVTASLHEANHQQMDAENELTNSDGCIQSADSEKTRKHPNSTKWTLCPVCKIMRPPRAGHCRTCGLCVQRLDHHCVWINSCVGQANHRSFLQTLCVFVLTAVYGISLVLRSLCPRQYLMTALFYCPGVYSQPSTALCFTCCWYSSIITVGLIYLLVAQVVNISFNVTGREAQLAVRNKKGQSRLWGLVIDTGEYSRGFYQNWVEFLTMTDSFMSFHSSPTDLV
ncbi:PREDICTED: palmitoyltransferase ZDHHC23-like isoform X1 [Cyprinodon variegatus]|uniref:palmitoyltransferase ZDHHC23-like isoform X1 n=2 Tax=Cyprinodon variegatus TaxID=28743 RepID=UPI000742B52C|nr:PREDICTED: palmitoyltransferase ZDHHC23-like isoform X1 [Cyprinodon variegatus]XP_015260124.1 PREDICTED: palmitoyltransferase ZDHHC23-like isoform X1 [Cyprinodon variegatus]